MVFKGAYYPCYYDSERDQMFEKCFDVVFAADSPIEAIIGLCQYTIDDFKRLAEPHQLAYVGAMKCWRYNIGPIVDGVCYTSNGMAFYEWKRDYPARYVKSHAEMTNLLIGVRLANLQEQVRDLKVVNRRTVLPPPL